MTRPVLPLRVEQALRLLPDIDALLPLRAAMISAARANPVAEPDLTIGKRVLDAEDLQGLSSHAFAQMTMHLAPIFEAAVAALEAEQRGDPSAAVYALIRAGEIAERRSQPTHAFAWYERARRVAEELRDRHPEIEALRRLGHLASSTGHFDSAARFFQRSLALAEAELADAAAARACYGLAEIAIARERWQGATSWLRRGVRFAQEDSQLNAWLTLGLGVVAARQDHVDTAMQLFRQTLESFEQTGDATGVVRCIAAMARLDARRGRHDLAIAGYRRALARLNQGADDSQTDVAIRLELCQLHLDRNRLPDAEDEIRRAEEVAITHNLNHALARLYVIMGSVRARQHDEHGFVFFEKAIELSRGVDPSPELEAAVYLEYARFRDAFDDADEARACRERSREILETLGEDGLPADASGQPSHPQRF